MSATPDPAGKLERLRNALSRFASDEAFAATVEAVPGMASPLGGASFSEDSRRGIAVIDAMTLEERRSPEAVAQPRRGEIAAAAGVAVDFVEAVLALAARLAEQADGIQQTHWWSCELRDLFSLPPDPPTPWKPRG